MKAALVVRPAISQRAMPAKMLSQTGAWRRMVVAAFARYIQRRHEFGMTSSPAGGEGWGEGHMTSHKVHNPSPGSLRASDLSYGRGEESSRRAVPYFTIALASFQTLASTRLS